MKLNTLKITLLFQGVYYLITGVWSIIDIESFSYFTKYRGDFFLKHTAGLLFSVLGAIFIYYVIKNQLTTSITYFAFITALGVALIELYYIPRIGNLLPFWIDFSLQGLIAIFLLFSQLKKTHNSS